MSFVYNLVNKKTVFLHIPKTGGKSINLGMSKYNQYSNMQGKRPFKGLIGHLTLDETLDNLHSPYDDYTFFATVRNPWDRAVSFFHYVSQNPLASGQPELGSKISKGEIEFEEFIEIMTSGTGHKVMRPQYDYILNKLNIDVSLVRNEFLQEDLVKFLHECGQKEYPHIPHINKSIHNHYSTYYSDRTIELIRNYESGIIKQVGYIFESL